MDVQGNSGISSFAGIGTTEGALSQSSAQLQQILQQLATGQRINQASDDAAGLGIAELLTAQVRGFKAASQNMPPLVKSPAVVKLRPPKIPKLPAALVAARFARASALVVEF